MEPQAAAQRSKCLDAVDTAVTAITCLHSAPSGAVAAAAAAAPDGSTQLSSCEPVEPQPASPCTFPMLPSVSHPSLVAVPKPVPLTNASLPAPQPAIDFVPCIAAEDAALHGHTSSALQLNLQACHSNVDTSLPLPLDPPSLPRQTVPTVGEDVLPVAPQAVPDQAGQAETSSDQHSLCSPSNTAAIDHDGLSSLVLSPSQSCNASLQEDCLIQGTEPGEPSCHLPKATCMPNHIIAYHFTKAPFRIHKCGIATDCGMTI